MKGTSCELYHCGGKEAITKACVSILVTLAPRLHYHLQPLGLLKLECAQQWFVKVRVCSMPKYIVSMRDCPPLNVHLTVD